MQPTQDNYPVFEANQVLTNTHLNQIFKYLDEQQRLTRANLIGIGIVCGLTITSDDVNAPSAITLTKGCGVTSEGYLIVEPDDTVLVSYRAYELPNNIDYPAFKNSATSTQYPLWELFPAGEAETTLLNSPAGFLNDKAVLLFLELKKAALRNCSPNNCDDKGSDVTVTVRRLLISKDDLDAVIADAGDAGSKLTGAGLEAALAAQLNLPDLRLPRYDAPNTQPVSSKDVLAAFLNIFSAGELAAQLSAALTSAYQAYQPILQSVYPNNPFAGFTTRFGFLDSSPVTAEQVRFLPYYYDFFDNLIRAYDEFRQQGQELLCACCPSEKLFPRHLMLGLLFPATESEAAGYRHRFLTSPAIGGCEQRTRDVVLLFQRLVEMTSQFTDTPSLPPLQKGPIDSQIRITPSKLGAVPLSEKAIPYYYQQTGSPPLHQLWNPAKSRYFKANQNLSYRAGEYVPAAPAFVTEPLAYDLEAYNFLRIEGHLGKKYQTVLGTLLSLKAKYRLPIDIIALRTGDFDESVTIDLSKESCRFQDLEMQYDVTREQLLCAVVKALTYFYNLPYETGSQVTTPAASQFDVINQYAPGFLVQPQSLGRAFEDYITQQGGVVPDIDVNIMLSWINIFPASDILVYYSFFYLIKLTGVLPDDLVNVNFTDIEARYNNLFVVASAIENKREQGIANLDGNTAVLKWDEIDDRLEDVLNFCQLDALKAIQDDYINRIKSLKKKQFLSHFLNDHPGIQHKAGVPPGGAFIIVYHQEPATAANAANFAVATGFTAAKAAIDPFAAGAILPSHINAANLGDFVFTPADFNAVKLARSSATRKTATGKAADTGAIVNVQEKTKTGGKQALIDAIERLKAQQLIQTNPDLQVVLDGLSTLLPAFPVFPGTSSDILSAADKIIDTTVNGLDDGTVIADFYLPYLCCSGCVPVQFVLSATPPSFTFSIGCTDSGEEGAFASVTITAKDGMPPYRIKIDDLDYQDLDNPVLLTAGEHTLIIQDANDAASVPQTVSIPEPIDIGEPVFTCINNGQEFVAAVTISGGVPPYTVNDSPIDGTSYTSSPVASGADLLLLIVDQQQCAFETTLTHTCPPPCDLPDQGQSQRCAYRLWLQQTDELFRSYKQASPIAFRFNDKEIDLGDTGLLLQMSADVLNEDFHGAFARIIKELNSVINNALGENFERLIISYEPAETDPFGILWIEHFISDTFSFSFDFGYRKANSGGNLSVRYGNDAVGLESAFDGVVFTHLDLDNKQTLVPAFDCSSRNQCDNSGFVKLCEGFDVQPAFTSERDGENLFIFAITESMPRTGIASWVWDFTTATTEPFYVGEKIAVDWQPGGFIRLTAISEKGCFSSTLENRT